MIILGIDQGISHCGYSILNINNKKQELNNYGIIVTKSKDDITKRVYYITTALEQIILSNKPEIITCERLFYSNPIKGNRNKSSSIISTNAITGIIIYLAGKYDIPFKYYVPGNVKKCICNNGRASKDDIINEIDKLFTIECNKSNKNHICDSIAIAITCYNNLQK